INRDAVEDKYFSAPRASAQPLPRPAAQRPQKPTVPASSTVAPKATASDKLTSSGDLPEAPATVRRTKNLATARTPAASKFADNKENETPSTTGSRGAKQKALSNLHDAAADIALYEKERKRKGGVEHGRSRSMNSADVDKMDVDKPKPSKRKRPSEEVEAEEGAESTASEIEEKPKGKRGKKDKLPPIKDRLIVTKYERWTENPKTETTDRNTLRNLGIHVTDNPFEATILCAPGVVRTRKFVCAFANAPRVVTPAFLDHCLEKKKAPDPDEGKFALKDPTSEQHYGFKLRDALDRAEQNKKRLLKGWQIFCTDGVVGGFDTFRDIVTANGGECMLYKGRNLTVSKESKRKFDEENADISENRGDEDEANTLYLISGPDTVKERGLWKGFRDMAARAEMRARVVSTDWILHVALAQQVVWDERWERREGEK
ncbi:hypothetical protein LTS18_010794, partial [Coniosporium uncinatum]